jgi:hypothetical protein
VDEARFREFLAETGAVMAGRRRGLPVPLRTLHQRILRHFAVTGDSPAAQAFGEWAAEAGVDPREALAGLVQADLAEAVPEAGRVLGAYPFAARPRGYQVRIDGGPAVEAYCAADALGVPAMVGRDAAIVSRDPHSGAEIRVEVRAGRAAWTPAGAVAGLPAAGAVAEAASCAGQPAADVMCPTVSFYASAADARAHQQSRGLTLEILSIPQALSLGSAAFGTFLDPAPTGNRQHLHGPGSSPTR